MIKRIFYCTFITLFVTSQTDHILNAQGSVVPGADDVVVTFIEVDTIPMNQSTISINETNTNRNGRQISETDDIDVDGPYGYIPRVVHGVNKIVKGILNGSVHEVMHGAFGIAPDDVADDLVGTYNRIFGIPDPDDLDETTEKTKIPAKKTTPKPKPTKGKNETEIAEIGDKTKTPSESSSTKAKGKKKKPFDYESKGEEDDDYANEEEDDDDE